MRISFVPYFSVRRRRRSELRLTVGTRRPQPASTMTSRLLRSSRRARRTCLSQERYVAAGSCPIPPGPSKASPIHPSSPNIRIHGRANLPQWMQRSWLSGAMAVAMALALLAPDGGRSPSPSPPGTGAPGTSGRSLRIGARMQARSTLKRRSSSKLQMGAVDASDSAHGTEHCQRCILPWISRIWRSAQPARLKKQSTFDV
eukprot:scaffold259550_cov33-Tisochrysis_lutea.AAC.2